MGETDKTPGLGLSRYLSPAGRTKEFFFANTRIVNVPHGIFTHQFRLITIGELLSRRLSLVGLVGVGLGSLRTALMAMPQRRHVEVQHDL